MSKIPKILILCIIAIMILFTAGCLQPLIESPQKFETLNVNMTVPFAPIPVSSPEGVNLAYELELSLTENQTFTLVKIEVIDPATGKILWSAEGNLLAQLYQPASDPLPTAEELENGTSKLSLPRISIWFTVDKNNIPDQLTHRIILNQTDNGQDPITVTGGTVTIRKDLEPVVIGSPVRGSGWIAIETTAPLTHHFLAQITMDSITCNPQRHAQDWVYVDQETGTAVIGNASLAKDYLGYGNEIYSVSAGTVVNLMDGLPDLEYTYTIRNTSIET